MVDPRSAGSEAHLDRPWIGKEASREPGAINKAKPALLISQTFSFRRL
jgi:hypothetical protein